MANYNQLFKEILTTYFEYRKIRENSPFNLACRFNNRSQDFNISFLEFKILYNLFATIPDGFRRAILFLNNLTSVGMFTCKHLLFTSCLFCSFS